MSILRTLREAICWLRNEFDVRRRRRQPAPELTDEQAIRLYQMAMHPANGTSGYYAAMQRACDAFAAHIGEPAVVREAEAITRAAAKDVD